MNQKAPSDGTGNVLQKKVLFCQGVRFQKGNFHVNQPLEFSGGKN